MPTTPIYALPYPAAADPADVPLDMQELAERIELVLPQAPAVRVYNSADQSINNGTNTKLGFNSERFDQAFGAASTMHDTTNNSRLMCRYAGIYAIKAQIQWAPNATGERLLDILLNNATVIARSRWEVGQALVLDQIVTCDYALVVGDYIEVQVYQSSGGALAVGAAANWSPEFSMVRIA